MWWLWIIVAYLVVAVLTFIGLCRRLVPLDTAAFVSLAAVSLVWPVTLVSR